MIWFYQYDESNDRSMIDVAVRPGFTERGSVEAPDWLSAKAALGFELTPLQAEMLAAQPERRAAIANRNLWGM